METRMAYCATCDRPVRVLVKTATPSSSDVQVIDPSDIVCLDHGEACSAGTICPIFDVPSEEMKEKVEEYRRTAEGG